MKAKTKADYDKKIERRLQKGRASSCAPRNPKAMRHILAFQAESLTARVTKGALWHVGENTFSRRKQVKENREGLYDLALRVAISRVVPDSVKEAFAEVQKNKEGQ